MGKYISSRNINECVNAPQAIVAGLAKDGGLYTPLEIKAKVSPEGLEGISYQDLAVKVIGSIFEEFSKEDLTECIYGAYDGKFDDKEIVPLRECSTGWLMELWHGPTSAFKDMALSLLPRLLTKSYNMLGEDKTVAILTATSGDTGKAALAAFADVPNTNITVFYPEDGVSRVQKLQMQTSVGDNVEVMAVYGNFDDCQRMIKEATSDPRVKEQCRNVTISSANSINIGRLVPQVVYYYSSYIKLVERGVIKSGDPVNFSVPTGNFGDILAGYIAKCIGLPVNKLICASNSNNVLTEFINTGVYDARRQFFTTMSPSMDIVVSSNLERLLFMLSRDDKLVSDLMDALKKDRYYSISEDIRSKMTEDFCAYWVSEDECRERIGRLFKSEGILIDPHTSVALDAAEKYKAETGDETPVIILSTASPFKFSKNVLSCIAEAPEDEFECMKELSRISGMSIPPRLAELETLPVRFTKTIKKEDGIPFIADKMDRLSRERAAR